MGLLAKIGSWIGRSSNIGAVPPDPNVDSSSSGLSVGALQRAGWLGGGTSADCEIPEIGTYFRNGRIIDEQIAFEVSAVFACINIQAKTISASTWGIYERTGPRKTVELMDDNLRYILNVRPNSDMSAQAMRNAVMWSMLSGGNGYAEIMRDMSGRIAGMYPIHHQRVKPFRSKQTGMIDYEISNGVLERGVVLQQNMIHVKGPSILGLVGMNTIGIASGAIALTLAANEFASSFFDNGGQIGGVLEYPGKLEDEPYIKLKQRWRESYEGARKAFRTAILDRGLKFTPVSKDAQKGQTIESRQFQIEEIARFWGIPPQKIGHMIRAGEANTEQQGKNFVNDCLRPIAVELQQEIDYKCLRRPGRNLFSRIDLDWVMEGTFKERMEGYREARNTGILNANEIREEIGYDSMGSQGDVYIVQGAMIPLQDVGLPYQKDSASLHSPSKTQEVDAEDEDETDVEDPEMSSRRVLIAWVRQIYERTKSHYAIKIRSMSGGRHNQDDCERAAVASSAEYLQRALSDVALFFPDSSKVFEFGMKAIREISIDDAICGVFGDQREKPSDCTVQKQGEAGSR